MSKALRLAVFNNEYPARVSTFFARDMRGLIENGIEVDVFSLRPLNSDYWRYIPEILPESLLPRDKVHHIGLLESAKSGSAWGLRQPLDLAVDALAIGGSAIRIGVQSLLKSTYATLKGLAWARQFPLGYDHVLAYWGNYVATSAYIFHRFTNPRVPFSVFLHAGTDLYRDQVFLRQKLLNADNIFTVCEFNRNFVKDLYPETYPLLEHKISVHHLGLNFAEFPFMRDGRRPNVVLAVGHITKEKGFDKLILAVGKLRDRGVNVLLEIVGDGEERESCFRLVDKLRLRETVIFKGWLPFHKVRKAMQRATILVHPSVGLGDAVPTVVKEAMALGTPVIASPVAGIPELLDNGRCGVLVPSTDTEALAEDIIRLLSNSQLRNEYAVSARHFAERKFDLWKNSARLAGIINPNS